MIAHPVGANRQSLVQIFAMPLVIGLLSTIGLVSALVGDEVWDALSWATLALPIVLYGYFILRPRIATNSIARPSPASIDRGINEL